MNSFCGRKPRFREISEIKRYTIDNLPVVVCFQSCLLAMCDVSGQLMPKQIDDSPGAGVMISSLNRIDDEIWYCHDCRISVFCSVTFKKLKKNFKHSERIYSVAPSATSGQVVMATRKGLLISSASLQGT